MIGLVDGWIRIRKDDGLFVYLLSLQDKHVCCRVYNSKWCSKLVIINVLRLKRFQIPNLPRCTIADHNCLSI